MAHPCGIEPWGNYLFRGGADIRNEGLGELRCFSDSSLLEILGQLSAKDLGRLALASKSLYCFANHEDLWRQAVLEEFEGAFTWCGCWQATYVASAGLVPAAHYTVTQSEPQPEFALQANAYAEGKRPAKRRMGQAQQQPVADEEASEKGGRAAGKRGKATPIGSKCKAKGTDPRVTEPGDNAQEANDAPAPAAANRHADAASSNGAADADPSGQGVISILAPGPTGGVRYLRVHGFYSDLLYQAWHCASVDIPAEWLDVDNVDRRRGLTAAQFREQYELPGIPVVLQGIMDDWPALGKWSDEYLQKAYGDRTAIVGGYAMRTSTYHAYAHANCDEMPLYLFDKHFTSSAPTLAADYSPPAIFGEDLFALLGPEHRPDYRWLIAGPRRSGSTFHVDPNATSAWNAVVRGCKKWVLYPPSVVPPGVHPSPDGADVATPVSIIEWFLNCYTAAQETKVRPIECIVRAGEVLYVPRGWWHTALNLQDGVAVTQNFVSEAGLPGVLAFLRPGREDLVSGCGHGDRRMMYTRLVDALRVHRPALLAAWEEQQAAAKDRAAQAHKLAALFKEEAHPVAPATTQFRAAGAGPPANTDAATKAGSMQGTGTGSTSGGGAAGANGTGSFEFGFGMAETTAGRAVAAGQDKKPASSFSFGFAL